jgi:Tol biopolymer transport system component
MKRHDCPKISLVLAAFLGALAISVGPANADYTFGKPQNLGPVINSPSGDIMGCFSADGLELYFSSDRLGGSGLYDIWVSTRESMNDLWGPPVNLGPAVNSSYNEICPSISSDGLTLYFSDDWAGSARPGGLGGYDIWVARRASRGAPWGTAVNVGALIDSTANEITPSISRDGLILVFASNRTGGQGSYDLWMSTRPTIQDEWGAPLNIGGVVNSGSFDAEPSLSSDDRALVFASQRPGGFGHIDLWMTIRKTQSDPWGPPVNLGPRINTYGHEGRPVISADARMLYFYTHTLPGNFGLYDLWQAAIIPVVDFNADEIVDIQDLLRLIESWGKDDPSVDIGPMPWGDGKIDAADLEVLMRYWQQEILDPALAAYWKLDEAEGSIAQNSASDNDGTLHGEPQWQPAGGKKAGALTFDGIDDYVSTDFVLNPADGQFSVLAWIQGGSPGDVVISQTDGIGGSGETWLGTEPSSGRFMSGLVPPPAGRSIPQPLKSESVVTDGQWHHIGFVWDGAYRYLYVDGVEVAKDTAVQNPLKAATGGLYIGAGKTLDATSFFSGLIDDVRIYDRAVKP